MSIPRSPERLLRCLLAAVLWFGAPWAVAQSDADAERARIVHERQQVEADYAAEAARCQAQFIVASCVEKARRLRRSALDRLSREQNVLDDAQRKQRAAERLQRMQDKRKAVADRPPEPAPRIVQRAAPASAPPGARPVQAPRDDRPSAAEQAQHKATYERRMKEAAEHRREVEQRNAKRAASRKPAAALSVPAASAASR